MSFPHPFRRGIEVILMDRLTGTAPKHTWHYLSDEKKAVIAEQLER